MIGGIFRRLALCLALLAPQIAGAQDVTLAAREGGLSLSGSLQGFDGEFYRIETSFGLLTVDAAGVICEGPGCPDLTAPRIALRIVGLPGVGETILPSLFQAFASARGLRFEPVEGASFAARLTDPTTDKPLADISFLPETLEAMRQSLLSGRAELGLAAATEPEFGSRILALDAMVPVVSPENPMPRLSTRDLASILSGDTANWAQIGGPDMPIVLHGLGAEDPLQAALSARLGRAIAPSIAHPDLATLETAVQADPWAIAVSLRAASAGARPLPLTDSCGFPLLPSSLAVKAEDYPLALPLFLVTPKRRLPLLVREFLDFLATPQAQAAIAVTGFVDRQPERQPMTADGLRLINAIKGAGEETTLADLQRLTEVMDGAERLSLTFRFQDGSSTLDAHSRDNLNDLARLIETDVFRNTQLILAGFSDGSGAAATNLALSQERAQGVLAQLRVLLPGLAEGALPQVLAFGEALPMACDETAAGRRLNRRVEVWLKPSFTGNPTTEN